MFFSGCLPNSSLANYSGLVRGSRILDLHGEDPPCHRSNILYVSFDVYEKGGPS